jgi:hypothetical protein
MQGYNSKYLAPYAKQIQKYWYHLTKALAMVQENSLQPRVKNILMGPLQDLLSDCLAIAAIEA